MTTLRTRLILTFVAASLVPVAATIWVASLLIDRSLDSGATEELDGLSQTLEDTTRQFYQLQRDTLRRDAGDGRVDSTHFTVEDEATWPDHVRAFWESGETERFDVGGREGDRLDLMQRTDRGVRLYGRSLGGIQMERLAAELRRTRELVSASRSRDLRRGLTLALVLVVAAVWLASLVPLIFLAHRISRPIRQLTAGLSDFAAGDWTRQVDDARDDEVGRAIQAFNRMAGQLRRDRDRLVYLTQMTSWQLLARKTAHELKNSLTPIRLTVEEMLARQSGTDRVFLAQAAQIVVSEIETLERRVRAFSEFAAEPPVQPAAIDLNVAVTERVAFLRPTHADVTYELALDPGQPRAHADEDLVKGILTNLLQNAADAAGPGGTVRALTRADRDGVTVEVHDSGPGLSEGAAATLFEPTITFKKEGMGLGLSIARKHALLSGGDITLVPGDLGGAAFRLVLAAAPGSASRMTEPSTAVQP